MSHAVAAAGLAMVAVGLAVLVATRRPIGLTLLLVGYASFLGATTFSARRSLSPASTPTLPETAATTGSIDYRRYLASPAWAEKRRDALRRAGHRCQLCNRRDRLEVHHRTYARLTHERDDDLTVLCRECHRVFHHYRGMPERPWGAFRPRASGTPVKPSDAGVSRPILRISGLVRKTGTNLLDRRSCRARHAGTRDASMRQRIIGAARRRMHVAADNPRERREPIRVGLVGLGKMGEPMGRNLLAAGFPLTVYNRSRPAIDALVAAGAKAASDPAGVAANADIVLTSLPDPAAVEQVYLGEHGLVAGARHGQVYVDTSTVGPGTSRQVATALGAKGAAFLDAPVSGGVAGAKAGSLTVMVGGDAAAVERARPVLAAIGQRINHVGGTGSGAIVKLINQLLVAINMAGVAEGLVLGVKAGADPRAMLDVLATSFGSSRMLERGVPLIIERNFGGGTPVDLIRKDLGLITDLAAELGVPLAGGETARAIFDRANATGRGGDDMTAVVRPLEEMAGVEVNGDRR